MLETGGKAVKAFGTEEQVVLNAPSLLCRSAVTLLAPAGRVTVNTVQHTVSALLSHTEPVDAPR